MIRGLKLIMGNFDVNSDIFLQKPRYTIIVDSDDDDEDAIWNTLLELNCTTA